MIMLNSTIADPTIMPTTELEIGQHVSKLSYLGSENIS